MKELLEQIKKIDLNESVDYLIDTCFLLWIFEHHKENMLLERMNHATFAMTSFNIEELMHIEHRLNKKTKESIRHFLKNAPSFLIVDINVHPGDSGSELCFAKTMLPNMIFGQHDPSDLVILGVAKKTHATVLTRDKHDLFNVRLLNFLNAENVTVQNKL